MQHFTYCVILGIMSMIASESAEAASTKAYATVTIVNPLNPTDHSTIDIRGKHGIIPLEKSVKRLREHNTPHFFKEVMELTHQRNNRAIVLHYE